MISDEIDTDECPLCLENFLPIKNRKSCLLRVCQRFREFGVRELRCPSQFEILPQIKYARVLLDLNTQAQAESDCYYIKQNEITYAHYYNQNNAGDQNYKPLDFYVKPDQIVQLNCNPKHIFHKTCLREYVRKQGNEEKNCPLCRSEFKAKVFQLK